MPTSKFMINQINKAELLIYGKQSIAAKSMQLLANYYVQQRPAAGVHE
jgi:hypothetical protein